MRFGFLCSFHAGARQISSTYGANDRLFICLDDVEELLVLYANSCFALIIIGTNALECCGNVVLIGIVCRLLCFWNPRLRNFDILSACLEFGIKYSFLSLISTQVFPPTDESA